MRRRTFIEGMALAAAWPVLANAQQRSMPVIGFLGGGDGTGPNAGAFSQGMRELGYVEGRNILFEYRWANGNPEHFPALVAELIGLRVDVIVAAGGTLAALSAKRATSTLPIVFTAVGNPVADGLVTSLARPGGNVTGLSTVAPELVGKLVGLLQQVVPGVSSVALLLKPDSIPASAREVLLKQAEGSTRALGVQLQVVEAQGPADFNRAFSDISAKGARALVVLSTAAFDIERQRIVDLAHQNRLPAVYSYRNYVDIGGLMSYGANFVDLHRRTATYVDKILKGAKPSDLPVEQPTKYELVINLKTAKNLGLTVPPTLLAQADEVVE